MTHYGNRFRKFYPMDQWELERFFAGALISGAMIGGGVVFLVVMVLVYRSNWWPVPAAVVLSGMLWAIRTGLEMLAIRHETTFEDDGDGNVRAFRSDAGSPQ